MDTEEVTDTEIEEVSETEMVDLLVLLVEGLLEELLLPDVVWLGVLVQEKLLLRETELDWVVEIVTDATLESVGETEDVLVSLLDEVGLLADVKDTLFVKLVVCDAVSLMDTEFDDEMIKLGEELTLGVVESDALPEILIVDITETVLL